MSDDSRRDVDRKAILKDALDRINALQNRIHELEQKRSEPIAVVGIGCRFPGGVTDADSYWHLLSTGVDAITEVPPERWDIEAYYDADINAAGKTYSRYGGYLRDIDKFDPVFFGISPREAERMDPQQRLFLEVAWEALENAGQAPDKLHSSQTGVYVGATTCEYLNLQYQQIDIKDVNAYTTSGSVLNVISGRVSHFLGLHGPAISVDTACSSSQVALHLAVQGLRAGDCEMAIAGGVNVILLPETYVCFSRWGMFSPDGRCRTFDAGANGFVRAEGCGAVVLKPLHKALADGDRIYALIRGTAANQDGPASGISVPNGLAQEQVIRKALQNAGVRPDQVDYVETHGTGTTLGDPIEVEALGAVYKEGRPQSRPLLIGSAKTNLGHMESASGVAGLIKAVLSLHHRQIPPHLHYLTPSPHIRWDQFPIEVPARLAPWQRSGDGRFAAVSSFGFSGTNVHVILQEAPESERNNVVAERPVNLLTLSARDSRALQELATRYRDHLQQYPGMALGDLCFTANDGRARLPHRLAVVAESTDQAATRLAVFAGGENAPGILSGDAASQKKPKIAFLYAGQGYQYVNMGKELYQTEPTFRQALEKCDELFAPYLKQRLLSVLYPNSTSEADAGLIDQTAYTQPALFSIQYALTMLWRAWGVAPSIVMGHSLGEFMAAHLAGVYTLEEAVLLVAERGRITDDVPAVGMMASVQASEADVLQAIAPYEGRITIAAINGPDSIVISGTKESVNELLASFEAQKINVRRLAISNAFHSPFIEPALDTFEAKARTVQYRAPRIRLVSTLTGKLLPAETPPDAGYWRRHLREPVQFYAAMRTLRELGFEQFVEIGAHPTLLAMGKRCFPDDDQLAWFPSLRRDRSDWQQMMETLGAMFVRGIEVPWRRVDQHYERRRMTLPTYPFQRRRFWFSDSITGQRRRAAAAGPHPLIDRFSQSPAADDAIFETELSTVSHPYFEDHQVHGRVVLPATGHLEISLAAARLLFAGAHRLDDVVIREPLILPEDGCRIQLIARRDGDGASFRLISLPANSNDQDRWKLHITGRIVAPAEHTAPGAFELETLRQRCNQSVDVDAYYDDLALRGLQFGSRFRGIARLWRCDSESLGDIHLPESLREQLAGYHFHPALLDACLQTFVAAWPANPDESHTTFLPLNLESYELFGAPANRLWCHVRLRDNGKKKSTDTVTGDLQIYNEDGTPVATVRGLLVKKTSADAIHNAAGAGIDDWLYEVAWRPKMLPAPAAAHLPSPAELATHAGANLSIVRGEAGLAAFEEMIPRLDALSTDFVIAALKALGFAGAPGDKFSTASLAATLKVVPKHQRLLQRMLAILAEDGILRSEGDDWIVERTPNGGDALSTWQQLQQTFPACEAELTLLGRCGPELANVMSGKSDPLQLLFPGGSLEMLEKVYQHSPLTRALNRLAAEAVRAAVEQLPAGRMLRVLEIGAGTGGTTASILPLLPAAATEYVFTDMSQVFLKQAKQKFADFPFVQYQLLDIEKSPAEQGFAGQQFDLVLAANVVHATDDLRQTMQHVRSLLAPHGLLLLIEGTDRQRWVDLTFGLTEGWWKFADTALRPDYALLSKSSWQHLLQQLDFDVCEFVPAPGNEAGPALAQHAVIVARGPAEAPVQRDTGGWIVFDDGSAISREVTAKLADQGQPVVTVKQGAAFAAIDGGYTITPGDAEQMRRLVQELENDRKFTCQGILHLWSLSAPYGEADQLTAGAIEQAQLAGAATLLHLAQALVAAGSTTTPRLWTVTAGTQGGSRRAPASVSQSPIWGLAKVISLEHPELQCTRIDVEPQDEQNAAEHIVAEVLAPDGEEQVAYRGSERLVARLQRVVAERANGDDRGDDGAPLQLQLSTPGALNSLHYAPVGRRRPGRGEVEIRVHASGLNFRDLLSALGMYPGDAGPLGGECSGEIIATGEGVSRFKAGDAVMAIAPGSFSTYVVTREELVQPLPPALDFESAATIPSAYMTAYYTLVRLGKLAAGEKVLVHSAAGGVGIAAVRLAQHVGAEVFATAGNDEKRAFLRSLGVKHVMDSRSLDFGETVRQLTGGQGVDVVLNSLSGDFIPASLAVLRDGGRFLEIGKRGIWSAGQVAKVKETGAYHIVDLAAASQQQPGLVKSILDEVQRLVIDGALPPLPLRVFPREQTEDAFRLMQQARHIGKIVVQMAATSPRRRPAAATLTVQNGQVTFRDDASFLITGGLAGLGLLTAQWLVQRGARHLALMARSTPNEPAQQAIAEMEAAGAQILILQGDVSIEADVSTALAQIRDMLPPLRGVIHSAGVLDDGAILQQSWPRFERVLAPKVRGAWLLHRLTRDDELELFVLYSSVASLLGSSGQGNHAAANAFLDALAHHRRAHGLAGTSIHWGAWSEIGAAAARKIGERLSATGIGTISPEKGLQALEATIRRDLVEVGVTPVNWSLYLKQYQDRPQPPFLLDMAAPVAGKTAASRSATAPKPQLLQQLKTAPANQRRKLLLDYVQRQALHVLGLESGFRLNKEQPLNELGLDSLMAVELRNLIGAGLELQRSLPATLLFDYPSVAAVADYLAKEVLALEVNGEAEHAEKPAAPAAEDELDSLSDEEASALLLQELESTKKQFSH